MALEKIRLDHETIRTLLLTNYGIEASVTEKLPLGSANCYKVSTTTGTYFLKEFQNDFPEDSLRREAELVNFLKQHDFPTAAVLPMKNGSNYFQHENRLVYVQEFLEGRTYVNDLPESLLTQSAELLGRLHRLLRGYDLPLEMDGGWLDGYSAEKAAAQYDGLLTVLEDFRDDPHYKKIREDLLWKRKFAWKNADLRRYYEGITYKPSHGDYTSIQFLCGEDRIHAVVDFSRAAVLPAVWEIMRSYVQSCGSCKGGAAFDTEEFCQYVARYRMFDSLTGTDLAAMPYVYLHQLARSKYGYKEYLVTKTDDREHLLDFTIWRTDICREIDRKKEEISAALRKLN